MKPRKPGYYVEGQYYGFNIGQANARARNLNVQYGRPVAVKYLDSLKMLTTVEMFGAQIPRCETEEEA